VVHLDDHFAFVVDFMGEVRDLEGFSGGQDCGMGFEEDDGFLRDGISEFLGMQGIIAAYTKTLHISGQSILRGLLVPFGGR